MRAIFVENAMKRLLLSRHTRGPLLRRRDHRAPDGTRRVTARRRTQRSERKETKKQSRSQTKM